MNAELRARLVTEPEDPLFYSAFVEEDARTALVRGLADYLGQVSASVGGTRYEFLEAFHTWAEPVEPARYPSIVVWSSEPGDYEQAGLTPDRFELRPIKNEPDHYLVIPATFSTALVVEMWCTDLDERKILTKAMEDALSPVEWMYGFRLELPYYHGVYATYEPTASQYLDNENDASRRYRKTLFMVRAVGPAMARVVNRPPIRSFRVGADVRDGG